MKSSGVTVINAIGSITFLLLTLVIYLSLKGRLGVYIALATAGSQGSNETAANKTNAGGTKTQGAIPGSSPGTSSVPYVPYPDLGALAHTYAPELEHLNMLNVLQNLTSPFFAAVTK